MKIRLNVELDVADDDQTDATAATDWVVEALTNARDAGEKSYGVRWPNDFKVETVWPWYSESRITDAK